MFQIWVLGSHVKISSQLIQNSLKTQSKFGWGASTRKIESFGGTFPIHKSLRAPHHLYFHRHTSFVKKLQFGRMQLVIWKSTICNLDKYTFQSGQIKILKSLYSQHNHLSFHRHTSFVKKITIWTNAISNLEKYNLQFGQIHFSIGTN